MIPAFTTAMQDRALRGHPREVYIWLHQQLDVVEFRIVKHAAIVDALGLEDVSVKRAIDRLLACGYIARGEREGRLWTYRLIYSRPDRAPEPAQSRRM